jgi:hypothetical protein
VHWTARDIGLTRELWSIYVENAVKWAEQGYGGVLLPNSIVFVNPYINASEAAATMEPVQAFYNRLVQANVTGAARYQLEMPSWMPFFKTFLAPNPAVRTQFCHSRTLPLKTI